MTRARSVPYPHLVHVARELTTAYHSIETATTILHNNRGPRSVAVRRGLAALVAIDKLRESLEPLARVWVASDASVTGLLYGHEAIARPVTETIDRDATTNKASALLSSVS